LDRVLESHLSSGNIGALAVHDYPEFNNVAIDEKGTFISKLKTQNSKMVAFTGIAVYSPAFLRFLSEGFSNVVDGWLKAVASGYRIGTIDVSGCYWRDIGTPRGYANSVIDVLKKEGERVYIHPTAEGCKDAEFNGYVVIEEGSILDKGTSLRNCIILPETHLKGESRYEDCIIGQDYRIELRDVFEGTDAQLIGTGGSDRKYYRVKRDKESVVLMECRSDDSDFGRHVEYTRFFQKYSIPVPRLIEVDYTEKKALFEDLGDISLYTWLRCPRKQEEIEKIYMGVIDTLISLHTIVTKYVSECPLLQSRVFDYEHLRWETGYFIERFVKGIRNIDPEPLPCRQDRLVSGKDIIALEDEFHRLAIKVDSFPKTVIHRDFQSQNIMIKKSNIIGVVDYQGARIGPPAYDLVSILWDPYYRLEDILGERLIDYYIRGIKGILGEEFSGKEFKKTLLPCRLQRHMQALGAYGFLSRVKGKKYFLKYVPEGLNLLKEDVFLSKNEYPEFYKLVMRL
ncbi:MAG: phosphotransferase, partial [Nitrospirota bacterium]